MRSVCFLEDKPNFMVSAVVNLISNSVKYTHTGGAITIKLSKSKDNVLIAVKDNGKGITKEDLPQLFLRFNRLSSAMASHVPAPG